MNLNLSPANALVATVGDSWTLIDNTSATAVNGTFAGLPEGGELLDAFAPGVHARISYAGGDGNDVVIEAVYSSDQFVVDTLVDESDGDFHVSSGPTERQVRTPRAR